MSVNHRNILLTEQTEWNYSIEATAEGDDSTSTMVYRDDFDGCLGRLPRIGSANPVVPALLLRNIQVTREEGGMAKITLGYKHRPILIKSYSFDPSTTEEPLLTNNIFKDLTEGEREHLAELLASSKTKADFKKAKDRVTSDEGIKAIKKITKGIESYLNPGLVWEESFSSEDLADLELEKILKTVASPPGPCPDAGANRNWLYLAGPATMQADGKTYDLKRRWQLSEEGKWDPDLYPAAS